MLAPMVRVGTLPMRLLAVQHGADLVWRFVREISPANCEVFPVRADATSSDEIIAWKLVKCKRVVNDQLGSIDYVDGTSSLVYRTCELERGRNVLQLGAPNAEIALAAAKLVEQDVAAIDINMGCPKRFSLQGGMGAALLSKPDVVRDILTLLVKNFKKPVTCKIRMLPTLEQTIDFVKMIESVRFALLCVR